MLENTFTILAIDPGNNLGIAVYSVSTIDFSIINIETRYVVLDNLVDKEAGDKLGMKLFILSNIIKDLSYTYNPNILVLERSFLNMKFPQAVIQLSQYIAIIETTFRYLNPFIKVFKYAPKYIKSMTTKNGDANKDDMKAVVNTIPEIANCINVISLSEHEVDAVAIGYINLTEVRKYPFLLYTIM